MTGQACSPASKDGAPCPGGEERSEAGKCAPAFLPKGEKKSRSRRESEEGCFLGRRNGASAFRGTLPLSVLVARGRRLPSGLRAATGNRKQTVPEGPCVLLYS